MHARQRIVALLSALLMALGLALATATPGNAARTTGESCAKELGLSVPQANTANQTPVVLVHGYTGNPGIWDMNGTSVKKKLQAIKGVGATYAFDYHEQSAQWVTEGDTAFRLAKTIICYSKLYGGRRVIVVTHSMGALLARQALSLAAYGSFAKDTTGLVVTLAAPHEGSGWANAGSSLDWSSCTAIAQLANPFGDANALCNQALVSDAKIGMRISSQQLADLPKFPANVAVKAIAGEVDWQVCDFWGCGPKLSQGGDLVVTTASATDEYTTTGRGDGKKIFKCVTSTPIENLTDAWCEHSHMVQAQAVQEEIKSSIEQYLAAVQADEAKPAFTITPNTASLQSDTVTLFNRLTIHPGDTWTGVMSEPDVYVGYADMASGANDSAGAPHVFFVDLTSPQASSAYAPDPLKRWSSDPSTCGRTGPVEGPVSVKIGGRPAQVYRQGCADDKYAAPRYAWVIPGQLFVAIDTIGGSGEVVEGSLETATWK